MTAPPVVMECSPERATTRPWWHQRHGATLVHRDGDLAALAALLDVAATDLR